VAENVNTKGGIDRLDPLCRRPCRREGGGQQWVEERRSPGAVDNPEAVAETEHAGTCRSRTALTGQFQSLGAGSFLASHLAVLAPEATAWKSPEGGHTGR